MPVWPPTRSPVTEVYSHECIISLKPPSCSVISSRAFCPVRPFWWLQKPVYSHQVPLGLFIHFKPLLSRTSARWRLWAGVPASIVGLQLPHTGAHAFTPLRNTNFLHNLILENVMSFFFFLIYLNNNFFNFWFYTISLLILLLVWCIINDFIFILFGKTVSLFPIFK